MCIIKNVLLMRMGSKQINRIKHPMHYCPPLALKYVQAILNNSGNYNIFILDNLLHFSHIDNVCNKINKWEIDLLVISLSTFTSQEGIELCESIRKYKNILIIGVGQDITARYEDYMVMYKVFDILIRGEFEQEVACVINQLNIVRDVREFIDGYHMRKSGKINFVKELDELPLLQWDKEGLGQYPFIYPLRLNKRVLCGYLSSSRGCPHSCIFCSSAVRKSNGKKIRLRSVKKIVDEMVDFQKLGCNLIVFEDDNFTASSEHVFSVCKAINQSGLGIKWVANVRVDEITSQMLVAMKEAGCILLFFGVESGSKRIIDILSKNSRRIDWTKKAKEVFLKARTIGIATCGLFIIGSPTETVGEIIESINLVKSLAPDIIKVHFFTVYPDSIAYKQFFNDGKEKYLLGQHHYLPPVFNMSKMSLSTLKKMQIKFYKSILFNPFFLFKHLRHYLVFHFLNFKMTKQLIKKTLFFLFSGTNK